MGFVTHDTCHICLSSLFDVRIVCSYVFTLTCPANRINTYLCILHESHHLVHVKISRMVTPQASSLDFIPSRLCNAPSISRLRKGVGRTSPPAPHPIPTSSRPNPSQCLSEYVVPLACHPTELGAAQLGARRAPQGRTALVPRKARKTNLSGLHSAAPPSSSTGRRSARSSASGATLRPRSRTSRSATTMRAAR